MTLTEIITDEEMKASEKVTAIAEKVKEARAVYTDKEAEIEVPKVYTSEGHVLLTYVSDADKVALAASEIANIRAAATSAVENNEGADLTAEVTRLIGINPILMNLDSKSDNGFI